MDLYLDTAKTGVSGYSITIKVNDPAIAVIDGLKFPAWSNTVPLSYFRSPAISPGKQSVNMNLVDVRNYINTSSPNPVYLGSFLVRAGTSTGLTGLTVTVDELDDDSGNAIPADVKAEKIDAGIPPGSLMVNTTPVQGALIYIDGLIRGQVTNYTFLNSMVPTDYSVKVVCATYVPQERTITVPSGGMGKWNFPLQRSVTFKVNSTPMGATISIDDGTGMKPGGVTNASITDLPAATYTVKVEKQGWYSQSWGPSSLRAGTTKNLDFTLLPEGDNEITPHGNITVNSTPPEAEIFIDGRDYRLVTPGNTEVDAGTGDGIEHRVYVALDGYLTPQAQTVTVHPKERVYVNFTLVPNPPPSLSCLWPPDHKLVDMTLRSIPGMTLNVTKITSDEPTSSDRDSGGARYAPDARMKGGSAFQLRAERSVDGNGRVYTITFTATSKKTGGVSTGSVTVCVPHDESGRCKFGDRDKCSDRVNCSDRCRCFNKKCYCIDDGQKYDATRVN